MTEIRHQLNRYNSYPHNLVPRVSHLTAPLFAPGGGKLRDPGNEVAILNDRK